MTTLPKLSIPAAALAALLLAGCAQTAPPAKSAAPAAAAVPALPAAALGKSVPGDAALPIAELMPLLEELQTQLICLRRLGDQASDAATAALLHGTCVPQPIDLLGQLREFCSILQEEAAQYALPFTVTLQADGLDVLTTTGDVSLLNGLLTNLVSNTLAADRAAHIMLLCTPGRLCYRDNGPGLPPDAAALLTEGQWSERLLHAGGLGLPLVAAYTSAMGWALTVGEGPGMSLQFTLPAAPPLDGMVLTSPTERLADRQNRRRLIRRELAVLVADTSMQ